MTPIDPMLPNNDLGVPGSSQPPVVEEALLAHALIYRFLATAFRYPEPEVSRAIRDEIPAVREALDVLEGSSDRQVAEHFCRLRASMQSAGPGEREREYTNLFGHVVRGRCPLYEVEYGDSDQRLQQPHELSDLSAFYRAFGLKLGQRVGERVDFIAVECEFMAFLCAKQAYAEEHAETALVSVTEHAARRFLESHLGRWVPACAQRIIDEGTSDFYGSLARFTLAWVTDHCRRLDVTPAAENLRLRIPLADEDACMNCPLAAGTAEENLTPDFPSRG